MSKCGDDVDMFTWGRIVSSSQKRAHVDWNCLFRGKAHLVFHWCLYNKQHITCPLMDMNFIFSWSTRYLTRSLRSLVRYRVDHSKIKFISTRGHVISSISFSKRNGFIFRFLASRTCSMLRRDFFVPYLLPSQVKYYPNSQNFPPF